MRADDTPLIDAARRDAADVVALLAKRFADERAEGEQRGGAVHRYKGHGEAVEPQTHKYFPGRRARRALAMGLPLLAAVPAQGAGDAACG